jgi:hypothetical protein
LVACPGRVKGGNAPDDKAPPAYPAGNGLISRKSP